MKYEFKPRTNDKITIEAYNLEDAAKEYLDCYILKGRVEK